MARFSEEDLKKIREGVAAAKEVSKATKVGSKPAPKKPAAKKQKADTPSISLVKKVGKRLKEIFSGQLKIDEVRDKIGDSLDEKEKGSVGYGKKKAKK